MYSFSVLQCTVLVKCTVLVHCTAKRLYSAAQRLHSVVYCVYSACTVYSSVLQLISVTVKPLGEGGRWNFLRARLLEF